MKIREIRKIENSKYVADICCDDGEFYFTSQKFESYKFAEQWVIEWCDWANRVSSGAVDSIYYIIQVPDSWAGPHENAHPFQGLFIKIGRSKNVLTRLRNLQTGTFGQLVIGALEPGGSKREAELHKQFSSLRRQGEWFACNRQLFEHIFRTWYLNKMLPPDHQKAMLNLADRIITYKYVRKILGNAPDTVNPALDEEWFGTTFIDLVYSSLGKSGK